MTIEELQQKREKLIGRMAAATRRLQAGETSIEYQDVPQMRQALDLLDREIARLSGASDNRVLTLKFSRGV